MSKALEEVIEKIKEILKHNSSVKKEIIKKFPRLKSVIDKNTVIGTGHQPLFYYPGILFKNFVTSYLAKKTQSLQVNFVVDTDIAKLKLVLPVFDTELKRTIINFPETSVCYKFFNPEEENIKSIFDLAEKKIKSLPFQIIKENFINYKSKFLDLYVKTKNLVYTISYLRNEFEKKYNFPVKDINMSDETRTDKFKSAVKFLIEKIEDFNYIYNDGVENLKKKKKIQPVRKLKIEPPIYELPLWFITQGKREKVYIEKKSDDRVAFLNEKGKIIFKTYLKNLEDDLKALQLYPGAIFLTFYLRIFKTTLFIHGRGGALYDKITDYIIKNLFGISKIPVFIIASTDIYLPLGIETENLLKEREYLNKVINNAQYKPEILLDEDQAKYYKQLKRDIASKLKTESNPEKKKEIHLKLKKIEEEIKFKSKNRREELKQRLSRIEKSILKEVYLEREYPYFLYERLLNFSEKFQIKLKEIKFSR